MASRSENNSPNHENQNENDKSDGNGVLRQRKTISPSHSRRSSAPNLKFLQEQQTSTNSNSRSRSVFRFKSNLIAKLLHRMNLLISGILTFPRIILAEYMTNNKFIRLSKSCDDQNFHNPIKQWHQMIRYL